MVPVAKIGYFMPVKDWVLAILTVAFWLFVINFLSILVEKLISRWL